MESTEDSKNKKQDSKINDDKKNDGTEAERMQEYIQIVENFMQKLREKFTITPEISKLINSVYNALDIGDFPETIKSLAAILRTVKETRARFKDFNLDDVLPAFTRR